MISKVPKILIMQKGLFRVVCYDTPDKGAGLVSTVWRGHTLSLGGLGILPLKILSISHLMFFILVNFYAPICAFSLSMYGGNVSIHVKETTKFRQIILRDIMQIFYIIYECKIFIFLWINFSHLMLSLLSQHTCRHNLNYA